MASVLSRLNVPFLRLNREQLPGLRIALDPVSSTLRVEGCGLDIHADSSLRSVWYRQPVFLRNTPSRGLSIQEQLERSQWMAFLRGLSVFDSVAWMNRPQSTYLAESKPYQLRIANRIGFAVPATLVTNDVSAIQALFSEAVVIKSVDTLLIRDGDDCLFPYTTVSQSSLISDHNLASAPVLAQTYLRNKIDLRVTVVGERVFAVKILRNGCGIEGDWRRHPRESLQFVDAELDDATVNRCLALVQRLGLVFGAIDLIEDNDGIHFIEINPTGEWAWLSSSERPIDSAIAEWLARY